MSFSVLYVDAFLISMSDTAFLREQYGLSLMAIRRFSHFAVI